MPPALLPARRNLSPDAVRSRNPSKSTLAHDAVAAAVSHKHYLIIRVGAGLIQFVYGSHSCLAAGTSPSTKFHFRHGFRGLFLRYAATSIAMSMTLHLCESSHWHMFLIDIAFITANPALGDIFECSFNAQSSKLESLFSLKRGKRDVRALSFEL